MRYTRTLCFSAALALFAGPVLAQELPQEGPVPTTALINVESKNPVQLDPHALNLQVNGRDTPINSLSSAASGNFEVAILIDDGLRSSFGQQLRELSAFINSLPPNGKVLVGYMQNGTVRSSGHFTADHQEISDDLRVTMGVPGSSASPYFCLSDFVKKWPSQQPAARFVMMLTNGVDPYNGSTSITNQDSPYVASAVTDAQRAGVPVYSIYYADAGFRGGRGSFSGQSYLAQMAQGTGGTSYYLGTGSPVSLAPFLKQFHDAVVETYVATFPVDGNKKMVGLKLSTTLPKTKLNAPQEIRPGTIVLSQP